MAHVLTGYSTETDELLFRTPIELTPALRQQFEIGDDDPEAAYTYILCKNSRIELCLEPA